MKFDNIQSLFEEVDNAKTHKKVFAQIVSTKFTYKQLLEDVHKLGNLFQAKGLKKGDRIILSTSDEYYTALFFLAFLQHGIVTFFLDPEVPLQRATGLINKTEAKGFVMDEHFFEERNIAENSNQYQLKIKKDVQKKGRLFKRLLKRKEEEVESSLANTFPAILDTLSNSPTSLTPIKSTDPAYVIFTSGTSSEPKGVMINHGNILAQLHTLSNVYALNEDSRLHNIMMMYYADGIIQGPLLTLYNQATWLRPMQFDLSKISELFHSIYKFRASHFFCVPLMLSFMDKFSEGFEDSFLTEDFKLIISSASKLEKKLWNDFERKFKVPLMNVYGMTETVVAGLYCTINEYQRKIGTVGIPIDCEAKITNSDGGIAKENEAGLLWLKGANVFTGYFNNPEATAAVLKNGWLNTGDVAVKDEEGFYEISGRVGNIINIGGANIYPEQISEMINTHPSVSENYCLGIRDEYFGEKLVCAVVLKPDCNLNEIELLAFIRPLLKQNQMPKEIYFFDDIPKGHSGKTQINAIKKLITNSVNNPAESSNSDYQNAIKMAASKAFGIATDRITMDDTAQTLDGWDSMAHLIFITSLEKHFKLLFTTSEMMNMTSMKSAHRILNQRLSVK